MEHAVIITLDGHWMGHVYLHEDYRWAPSLEEAMAIGWNYPSIHAGANDWGIHPIYNSMAWDRPVWFTR